MRPSDSVLRVHFAGAQPVQNPLNPHLR